jgi:hypothetical protein
MEVIVIGGGASGMMAALTAAESSRNHVTLLERQARPARKLLATGNGRCNLTNLELSEANYHTETPELLYALRAFDERKTLGFFSRLGLVTVAEENGRVYPFSDSANSVADVLRFALERAGVTLCCGEEVSAIRHGKNGFNVTGSQQAYHADRVILACGGPAGAKLGGSKSGIDLLRSLGHSATPLTPSLVQLKTDDTWVRSLKGVRAEADVRLISGDKLLCESGGEVQFTEYGVSGPAIFDISREAARHSAHCEVVLDLMPLMDYAGLEALLYERAQRFDSLTLENLLTGVLHNRLGRTLVRAAGFSLTQPLSELSDGTLRQIAATVKAFRLPVIGTMGFDGAQVTAGGASGDQFDPQTLESRLVPGLYVCGEVLDVDGDCGGYNLQWAWSSGRLAGQLLHREESA